MSAVGKTLEAFFLARRVEVTCLYRFLTVWFMAGHNVRHLLAVNVHTKLAAGYHQFTVVMS